MKNVLKFILFFAFLFNVGGCSSVNEKILVESVYNIQDVVELDESSFVSKLNINGNEGGDDFLLYIHTPGCSGCATFKSTVLKPVIQEINIKIYSVTNTLAKKYLSLGSNDASPVLIVFKDGKQIKKVGSLYAEDVFSSKEGLKSFINEHIIVSRMQIISSSDLDTLIASKQKVVTYFSWSECGDCASFKANFLDSYLLNNQSSNIFFMLETNEWRSQKETNPEVWEAFAAKYSIDSYQGGKIPSIVCYENGVKKDMAVYLNDVMNFSEEGINITGSYYQDAPFIGNTFASYNDYKNGVKEFHNQKIEEFLEKYYE